MLLENVCKNWPILRTKKVMCNCHYINDDKGNREWQKTVISVSEGVKVESEFQWETYLNGKSLVCQSDEEEANAGFHNNDRELLRNCCAGNTGNCKMTIDVFMRHKCQHIFWSMKFLPQYFLLCIERTAAADAGCVFFAFVCEWFRVELCLTCKIVRCWQRSLSRHVAIRPSQTVYSWSPDQSQMLCVHSSAPWVWWQVVFHTVWISAILLWNKVFLKKQKAGMCEGCRENLHWRTYSSWATLLYMHGHAMLHYII